MFGLNFGATSSSAGGGDPDAENYFNAVSTAGGALSETFKTNYNTMVLGLKSDSVYSKLLRFNPNAGGTEAASEVDQIIPTTNNINFVNSPTIDAEIGVSFNGTNQYATTGFIPSTDYASATDWQLYAYMITASTPTNKAIIAARDTKFLMLKSSSPATGKVEVNGLNNFPSNSSTLAASGQGVGGSRVSNTSLTVYVNGVGENETTTTDTGTPPTFELYYGARNSSGTADLFNDGKSCFMTIAQGMTATDMLNLHNRISTFISSL
jgi:hypothetical protein